MDVGEKHDALINRRTAAAHSRRLRILSIGYPYHTNHAKEQPIDIRL